MGAGLVGGVRFPGVIDGAVPALRTPTPDAPLRIVSLGAGVQSSTLLHMAQRGDIAPVDAAIFADTGWEPTAVYDHLAYLRTMVSFPIVTARRAGPNLGDLALAVASGETPKKGTSLPPWYTKDPDGMLPKYCSSEFKTKVVWAATRQLLGLSPRQRAPKFIAVHAIKGISADEKWRIRGARKPCLENHHPLVDLGMWRYHCVRYCEERQIRVGPKSSCIFCPYRTRKQHRALRDDAPADWDRLIAFDQGIRPGYPGMRGTAYVQRTLVPLDQVDLTTEAENGQEEMGFILDCEGVCGV